MRLLVFRCFCSFSFSSRENDFLIIVAGFQTVQNVAGDTLGTIYLDIEDRPSKSLGPCHFTVRCSKLVSWRSFTWFWFFSLRCSFWAEFFI